MRLKDLIITIQELHEQGINFNMETILEDETELKKLLNLME